MGLSVGIILVVPADYAPTVQVRIVVHCILHKPRKLLSLFRPKLSLPVDRFRFNVIATRGCLVCLNTSGSDERGLVGRHPVTRFRPGLPLILYSFRIKASLNAELSHCATVVQDFFRVDDPGIIAVCRVPVVELPRVPQCQHGVGVQVVGRALHFFVLLPSLLGAEQGGELQAGMSDLEDWPEG